MLLVLIVLLLVITAGVIWALHRSQLRKQVEVVDRIDDLPPLESTSLPDFTPQQSTMAVSESPTIAPATAVEAAIPATEQTVTPAPSTDAPPEAMTWQDQVKLLKDKGDLEAAMLLCQQNFPKAQAFQQAAVLLRLRIRQRMDQQQPVRAEAARLYRCAVLADLFRSGSQLKPVNARNTMKGLSSVEFQYARIGHQQLKLLTKSDVKLLEQLWGKANQHIHAEQELGVLWEQLCRE